jgi:chromosome segregation ATPase
MLNSQSFPSSHSPTHTHTHTPQVEELEGEVVRAREQAGRDVQGAQLHAQELQQQIDELQTSSKKLRNTLVERFSQAKQKQDEEIAELQERLRDALGEARKLRESQAEGGEGRGSETLASELGPSSVQLEGEISGLKEQLSSARKELEGTLADHTKTLEQSKAQHKAQLDALREDLAAAEATKTSQAAQLAGLVAQLETVSATSSQQAQAAAVLTTRLRESNGRAEDLAEQLAALQGRFAALEDTLGEKDKELLDATKKVRTRDCDSTMVAVLDSVAAGPFSPHFTRSTTKQARASVCSFPR